jgi:hypothetical protein
MLIFISVSTNPPRSEEDSDNLPSHRSGSLSNRKPCYPGTPEAFAGAPEFASFAALFPRNSSIRRPPYFSKIKWLAFTAQNNKAPICEKYLLGLAAVEAVLLPLSQNAQAQLKMASFRLSQFLTWIRFCFRSSFDAWDQNI